MEEFEMRKLFFASFLTLSVLVAPAIVNAQETAFDFISDVNLKKCLFEKYSAYSNAPETLQMLSCSGGSFTRESKKIVSIEGISKFTNLIYIDLSYNNVREIPANIGALVNLKTMDLSHNSLKTLPVEIASLVNLQTLDLSNNKIRTFPVTTIAKLENLRFFRV